MAMEVLTMNHQQRALLQGLDSLYRDKLLCDASLQAEDTVVDVHKCVLAASSPYFRAMFTFDKTANPQAVVKLENVTGQVLWDLVQFFYSGDIVLTEGNVQGLVTAAEMMQITALKYQCEAFMCSALSVENCLEVFNFADFQNLQSLKDTAENFIHEHFSELCQKEAFLNMRLQNVLKIFRSDDLSVAKEEIVLEAALKWVKHDVEQRKKDLILLLLGIRFPLISLEFIDNVLCHEPLISENPFCQNFLQEARDVKKSGLSKEPNSEFAVNFKPRLGMCRRKMLIFSGGTNNKTDRAFCCYDPETKLSYYGIKQHPSFDFKCKIDHYRILVTDEDEIFFLGGIFYDDYHFESNGAQALSTVLVYNEKRAAWELCSPMKFPRCAFGACHHAGRIYVFGGYSHFPGHEPKADVTVYDTATDTWSLCDGMPIEIALMATAVHKEHAYLFGGIDSEKVYLSSVLQYSFKADQWSLLSTEMPRPQAEAVAVTHTTKIYVLGGCNQAGNLSVLIYDLEKSRWSFGEDFPDDRKFTSVTRDGAHIYVCGGVRHFLSRCRASRRSKTVETKDLYRYDIENNTWTKEARFVEYGNNYACVFASVNVKHLTASDFVVEDT